MVDDRYDQNGSDCLFSAFLNQIKQHSLEQEGDSPKRLRANAVKWLTENKEFIIVEYGSATVEDLIKRSGVEYYLRKMANEHTWGDEIVLYALAQVYNLEVCVISSLKNSCELLIPDSEKGKPVARIFIGSIENRHFVSTRPMAELRR
jgi:hypothetical protein